MLIINQPFQGQLGSILKEEFASDYKSATIFSAFAKNSGVLRLKESMENFKANGGSICAFIGIDLDGTSYEALLNLYSLCDELFVIHSENISTTYHSKLYLLENPQKAWCAIGSNNLTGGGLWTNFESCSIQLFNLPEEKTELTSLYYIIDKYKNPDYPCSTKISSIADIDTLLDANYISKEVTQKINNTAKRLRQAEQQKRISLFGTEKVSIPTIMSLNHSSADIPPNQKLPKSIIDIDVDINTNTDSPAFTNEQFWFEMRKSTGGSTSTIKFAPNNGSWRIQLKGDANDGSNELSKYGSRGDFVYKILVFEKINTDYYVLSLLAEKELDKVKSLSRVWARNGSSTTSKAYGML